MNTKAKNILLEEIKKVSKSSQIKKMLTVIPEFSDKISGGWGFWGHGNRNKINEKAWIIALHILGYDPVDILFYGDWRDGRHIADNLDSYNFKNLNERIIHVFENAQPDPVQVKNENVCYYPNYRKIAEELTEKLFNE